MARLQLFEKMRYQTTDLDRLVVLNNLHNFSKSLTLFELERQHSCKTSISRVYKKTSRIGLRGSISFFIYIYIQSKTIVQAL